MQKKRKFPKWLIISIGAVALIVVLVLVRQKKTPYQFVSVTKGAIVETVSITGNTAPTSSVSLGFGNGGTIASVHAAVGERVAAGTVIASLDTSDLSAQLKQAQASLAIAKAQGENTSVNVDQVKNQQDILVANAYHTLLTTSLQAVPEDPTVTAIAPTITGDYTGPEGEYEIRMYPSNSLSGESFNIGGLESGFANQAAAHPLPLGTHGLYIQFPSGSLAQYGNTVWVVSIPNKKSAVYTANYNAYLAAQANRDAAVSAAQASLANTAGDASVVQAQVQSAQAAVQGVEAKLKNSKIVAPISGTVTQNDAKPGEFASPGATLISIISEGSFEVDALASEIDVGKIALGNAVSMTFDAFPGQTFAGKVFYIDPAQTTTAGVVGYKIKISFDTEAANMKSGLTANLTIQTNEKDDVLILPQYAILQNDDGTFVQTVRDGVVTDVPVQLGLQDENGNVEIVSGVSEGDQVLNIGLKS